MVAQPSDPRRKTGTPQPPTTHHYPPPPPGTAYQPPAVPTPIRPQPAAGRKPSSYLVLSIIAIFFSLIFGAIGIYFSTQVTSRWDAGDAVGAKKASNTALTLDIIGIVVGILLALVYASSG